jgi:hypothetical protein
MTRRTCRHHVNDFDEDCAACRLDYRLLFNRNLIAVRQAALQVVAQ